MAEKLVIRRLEDIPTGWLTDEQRLSRVNQVLGKGDLISEMYTIACNAGVEDKSYNTVRFGGVQSFAGDAKFEYRGKVFLARGFKPKGTPEFVSSRGGIIFTEQ